MLRAATLSRATLRIHTHLLSSILNQQQTISISIVAAILSHQPRSIPRFPIPSRCYARMARRIPPPVRRNADENEESESESESEVEENALEFDDDGDNDDDGEKSEEWIVMDFGALSKKENNGSDKEEQS